MRGAILAATLAALPALAGCLAAEAPAVDLPPLATLACSTLCRVGIETGPAGVGEPMLAVNPADPLHLVVAGRQWQRDPTSEKDTWDVAYVSRDGGATWSGAQIPGGPSAGRDHALFTTLKMSDPVAVVLSDGTVIYAGNAARTSAWAPVAYAALNVDIFVARSPDGGATFPDVRIMAPGPGTVAFLPVSYVSVITQDKPWLARGPDDAVLLAWSRHDAAVAPYVESPRALRGELLWSATRDRGATWTEPAAIAGGAGLWWGASPAFASDGTMHVAYLELEDAAGGAGRIMLATSRDGATWEKTPIAEDVPFQAPQLGVRSVDGVDTLLVAYVVTAADGKATPVVAASKDGGATWSEPLALDESATWAPMPALAVAADGTAYVSFWRTDEDGLLERRLVAVRDMHVVASATLDRGIVAYEGDYMGQVALADGAYSVWTSRPDGRPPTGLWGARHVWG